MRNLVNAGSFDKKLRKFVLQHPELRGKIKLVLVKLSKDVYSPSLRAHKLSGNLKLFYGASIDYHYRIVFHFDNENVYLFNIGTHDEVY